MTIFGICVVFLFLKHSTALSLKSHQPDETQYFVGCSARNNLLAKLEEEAKDCPNCKDKERYLSAEELKQLRLELWKKEFLRKMNLDEAPCIEKSESAEEWNPSALIATTGLMESENNLEQPNRNTEYSTEGPSIVLFSTNNGFECENQNSSFCSRFEFESTKEIDFDQPGFQLNLEAWLYREFSANLTTTLKTDNGPMEMSESSNDGSSSWTQYTLQIFQPIINVFSIVIEAYGTKVSETGNFKPFLLLSARTHKTRKNQRGRRSVDCSESSTSSSNCCRETHIISFEDMGWDEWIVAPRQFKANYCKGKCTTDAIVNTRYYHTYIFHSHFLKMNQSAAESLGLSMCCVPSKMSPLTMIYKGKNDTVYKDTLPNMIVESCECI